MDEAIARMTELKDKKCACKETACAQTVSDEMMKWGQDRVKSGDYDPDMRPTDDESKRMPDVTKAMVDCMTKAMSAGSP